MFDEAIRALQNNQPEQAIHLILVELEERQKPKDFNLLHHEDEVKSTTFLGTTHWESA